MLKTQVPRVFAAIAVGGVLAISANCDAEVRAVHASPNAPNVDVIVNDDFGSPAFSDVPFTAVSDYAFLPSATYNFKVVPTGETEPAVIDADVPIDETKDYTVAATDLLENITPVLFEDDNTRLADMARVRFLHLSPNAPTVDVQLAGGGMVLFDDVSFQESGGYISVPAGTYDLEVVVSSTGDLALDLPGIQVANDTVYTAYAMGLVGDQDTPLQAIFSVDAVPEPGTLGLLSLAVLPLAHIRRRNLSAAV